MHGTFRGGTSSLPITSPNLSFAEFLTKMNKSKDLNEACNLGDQDAKLAIETLAPDMAKILKENKEWDKPKLSLASPPKDLNTDLQLQHNEPVDTDTIVSHVTLERLGPVPEAIFNQDDRSSEEYQLALSHLVTDIR